MKLGTSLIGIMFCQLFALGAINPLLSHYLQHYLHFNGVQTGWVLAASIVSSLVGPIAAMKLIDRAISSRWMLVLCHSAMAVCASALLSFTDFPSFLAIYALFCVFAGPTAGLVNAIVFQNLPGGSRAFGGVRFWGTLGWIGAGWFVSGVWLALPLLSHGGPAHTFQPLILVVAAFGSIATMGFALSLPSGSTARIESRRFIPPETRQVLREPALLALGGLYLASQVLDRFYWYGSAPYLANQGLPEAALMPLMSLGQITELATLFTLAAFLRRFGFGATFLVGLALQVLRFGLFCTGSTAAAVAGLALNGFIFAYLYTAIVMYFDSRCSSETRAGVHQIIAFFFGGVSSLAGNLAAGALTDRFGLAGSAGMDWRGFWLYPLGAAVAILALAAVGFVAVRAMRRRRA